MRNDKKTEWNWLWLLFSKKQRLRLCRDRARAMRKDLAQLLSNRPTSNFRAALRRCFRTAIRDEVSLEVIENGGGIFAALFACGVTSWQVHAEISDFNSPPPYIALLTLGVTSIATFVFALYVSTLIVLIAELLFGQWGRSIRRTTIATIGVLLIGSAVSLMPTYGVDTWPATHGVLFGSKLFGALIVSMILAFWAVLFVTAAVRRHYCFDHPQERFLVLLLQAASLTWKASAVRSERRWSEPPFQRKLVLIFEEAAQCLELIPQCVLPNISSTAEWLRKECGRRAEAVREWKRAVLLPKPDTREWLLNKLEQTIQNASRGAWDLLESCGEFPHKRSSWYKTAWQILRALLAALLPLAAVWTLHTYADSFIAKVEPTATAVAIVWAFVHIMSLLEPGLKEKVSLIKELPVLPFLTPKGDDHNR